ncbi:B3 domain-containing protein [Cardamine amara subsp. amara]|uniref:B3 domain-containing protein n=1 Tax=Cardamine amara subsp. amara TaxID=228776 RepID=A0ABD1AR09_CARAN
MSYDDHLTDSREEKWSRFCMLADVAIMVYEEDQRRRLLSEKGEESKFHKTDDDSVEEKRIFYLFPKKTRSSLVKGRKTQLNPNGASSLLLDLNKIPTDSETENPQNPSSELVVYDEEQHKKKGKAKIVSEGYEEKSEKRFSEKKFVSRRYSQQQNYVMNLNGASTSSSSLNLRCLESSLVLFDEKSETKDPPNPNYQTSPSSCLTENTNRKRRAVSQRKRTGGFKKAKIAPFLCTATEAPEWVFQVIRDMNGYVEEEPRLFFERYLSVSDVKSSLSRLLIPFKKLIRKDFLTNAESRAMANEEDEESAGVGTILVNQRSEKWGLRLKIWFMEKKDSGKGTLNYILNWGWNDVVKGNNLIENSKISLWTFRCRGVLCFALGIE